MNCPTCMKPVSESDVFCQNCGTRLKDDTQTQTQASGVQGTTTDLNSLNQLLLTHSKLGALMNFTFSDTSGNVVATTQGQLSIPIKYTVLDSVNQPLFGIGGQRGRGLMFYHTVVDQQGNTLATIKPKSGFGKKYTVEIGGMEPLLLKSDLKGLNYELLLNDQSPVAQAHRHMMAMVTERTEIEITEGTHVDRRIALASMLLVDASTIGSGFMFQSSGI